ncbi:MAG: GntR family transcriptional regulator [Gammaproteobacteria bacterium]|nr:GntR family transcriptional regulator [Gammaproteobacteria bacterium]
MSASTPSVLHMQDSVKPLARQSLAERVADELRNLVLLEKLAPGSTIPERETAAALGVSRTPLRESLRILASEGLVNIAPNRAPTVANPSLEELGSLLEVLGSLESLAGELACAKASDETIEKLVSLEKLMQDTSEDSEPLEFFQLDMQFHHEIVNAAENEPLIEAHRTFNARLWRARFISSRQRVNRPGTLKQHRDIVQALQKRDAAKCSLALKTHLHAGYNNIKSVVAPDSSKEPADTLVKQKVRSNKKRAG